MFSKEDLIFAYTRAQAIEDGVLVDVTDRAKEAGGRFRPGIRRHRVLRGTGTTRPASAPPWDLLWMLRNGIQKAKPGTCIVLYQLYVRNDNRKPRPVTLKAVCGPDDDGSPCISVMLPDED